MKVARLTELALLPELAPQPLPPQPLPSFPLWLRWAPTGLLLGWGQNH
jgi:hypothetical protein